MITLSNHKIGILGGVSWHSTMIYYQTLQQMYQQQKGESHSLPLVINSLDLQEVLDGFKKRKFLIQDLQRELCMFAQHQCNPILIASHTMHALFTHYQTAFPQLNFVHIADAVGIACQKNQIKTVGLLGTRFTMQQSFYQNRLRQYYNINVEILSDEISKIHQIITHELVHGIINPESQTYVEECVHQLIERGCQKVILGCTELPMLFSNLLSHRYILDPIPLHCQYALDLYHQIR